MRLPLEQHQRGWDRAELFFALCFSGLSYGVPKKQNRTEQEIHAMIIKEAQYRLGCTDFDPEFTLHRTEVDPTHYPSANWDVESVRKR